MRRGTAAALALALAACAGPRVAPVTAPGFAPTERERAMVEAVGEARRKLERMGGLVHDDALDGYLAGVERRLLPPGLPDSIRFSVRVLDDPDLNAGATPDGTILVCAGLLAEIEDEAQLAVLLAHETAHVLRRHALRSHLALSRNALLTAATLGLGLLPAAAAQAGLGRDQEREADADAVAAAASAGYAPAAAARFLERLDAALREQQEPDAESWLGDHPTRAERIARSRELAAATPAGGGGEAGTERFREGTRAVRLRAARLAFLTGRLARAERLARALAAEPGSAAAWVLLGDLSRLRDADLAEAARRYRAALAIDPSLPEAHRELGRTLLRANDRAGARDELRRYLALRPGAPDRPFTDAELRWLEAAP